MRQRHSQVQALPPGSTIGILGAGQLGRMLALAAAKLGFRTHVFSDQSGPACDVAAATTIAGFDDRAALSGFSRTIDVATYEFENIPVATVAHLSQHVPVRPGGEALACAQDRLREKRRARELGGQTAAFAQIDSTQDLLACIDSAAIALPAILKTRRLGYDGKGQVKLLTRDDAFSAFSRIGDVPAILEAFVPFEREVSVVAARSLDGAFASYDVTQNVHRDHILHTATVPADLSTTGTDEAIAITRRFAEALDYVGVLAVEFFVIGGGTAVVVNEVAPRVHNSGHWTMDACIVDQFENHIRAIAGWPLGSTKRHGDARMTNLIGSEIDDWFGLACDDGTSLHIYGKSTAKPGRKMGHITRVTRRP